MVHTCKRPRAGRAAPPAGLGATLLLAAVVACGDAPSAPEKPEDARPMAVEPESTLTGRLWKTYEGDLDLCATAAKAALQHLGLLVRDDAGDVFRRHIRAETQDGEDVDVRLASLTRSTTRVDVKVGWIFGDRDVARRIHSEIEGELHGRVDAAGELKRRWDAGRFGATSLPSTTSTLPRDSPQR